jgi:hypothetical protein
VAQTTPPTAPIEPEGTDAGLAFRLEMSVTNFIYGYWRVMLGVAGAALLGFFAYGQYTSYVSKQQRAISAEVASVEFKLYRDLLPKLDEQTRPMVENRGFSPDIIDGMLMQIGTLDDATKASLRKSTDAIAEIARGRRGPAAAQAALDAANFYERLEAKDERKAMLEIAAREGTGPIRYGAEVSLALGEIDAGSADAGIARLKTLTGEGGFLAEDASYILARTLDDSGKKDEARAAYGAFLEKWPESSHAEKVKMFQTKLDEAKPAVPAATPTAPAAAPAEGAAAPAAEADPAETPSPDAAATTPAPAVPGTP